MSDEALRALREAMTPPWLREINLEAIAAHNHDDLAVMVVGLVALFDYARTNVKPEDWAYLHRQIKEILS